MVRILLVLIAVGLIVYGLFEPFLGVKLFKDHSFFELSKIGSFLWIGLVVGIAIIAVKKIFKLLLVAGLLAAGLLAYSVYQTVVEKESIREQLHDGMDASPMRDVTVGIIENIHFREGFMFMATGVLLLLGVAIVGPRIALRKKNTTQDAGG